MRTQHEPPFVTANYSLMFNVNVDPVIWFL
jgi:hypothetical protein